MNTKLWIAVVLVLAGLAIWGCAHKIQPADSPPSVAVLTSNCGAHLAEQWRHVYHADRLDVKEQCKVVTGTIDSVRSEPDGDYHIRLQLDSGQESLLNEKNMTAQHGDMVVEAICEHTVTQDDAIASCEDFAPGIPRPGKGMHVRVAGSYVHDTERGHGWMEIHPAAVIQEVP
jgi:hypothetical protein